MRVDDTHASRIRKCCHKVTTFFFLFFEAALIFHQSDLVSSVDLLSFTPLVYHSLYALDYG